MPNTTKFDLAFIAAVIICGSVIYQAEVKAHRRWELAGENKMA